MSACISRAGEYSDHVPDADHVCTRCGVFDEDGLIAARNAEVAALTAERDRLREEAANIEVATKSLLRGYSEVIDERDALAAQLARAETVISGPLSTLTLDAVQAEAIRARAKHGERTVLNREMPAGEKVAILGEEFGEVCRALTYDQDRTKLVGELIQVASVSLLWVESIEGQATPATTQREGAGDGDPA